ncbi:HalX domain-containing protein [Halorubrum vacuolatum]|uniref:Response regulator receiver domain-containing protein n=1 Tax=Halorubrum vacuolatum TaxID=63740 RepID=A0A238WEY0_HALVU|nr:HalX domain-containing protein [Halorubrum vacuolatum]SNR45130.1 Response regulator receiver domain-containing protein [Halorubrum vacuolatum]
MGKPNVLVVEDEADIAALYAGFLRERYSVTVATTAAEAIDVVDESFDAVLLDRRLPDGSGDEVLEHIRDRELDCRVAMVTAVEPDFDIIDMGFDLYLTKPVSRSNLLRAIETLLARTEYDDLLQEAAALASKRAVLKSEKPTAQLERNEAYGELLERLEALDADIDDLTESFSMDDYRAMFRDIGEA